MKIGIISDSHGKTKRLGLALDALAKRNIQAIVHCGDIIGTEGIVLLGKCPIPVYLVAGNMDRNIGSLKQSAEQAGVNFSSEVIEVPLGDGRYLVATHGSDEQILNELIAEQRFPYVCHGHTHRRRDERRGKVRVINPGSLYHPREPHTPAIVVLDTEADSIEWIKL